MELRNRAHIGTGGAQRRSTHVMNSGVCSARSEDCVSVNTSAMYFLDFSLRSHILWPSMIFFYLPHDNSQFFVRSVARRQTHENFNKTQRNCIRILRSFLSIFFHAISIRSVTNVFVIFIYLFLWFVQCFGQFVVYNLGRLMILWNTFDSVSLDCLLAKKFIGLLETKRFFVNTRLRSDERKQFHINCVVINKAESDESNHIWTFLVKMNFVKTQNNKEKSDGTLLQLKKKV